MQAIMTTQSYRDVSSCIYVVIARLRSRDEMNFEENGFTDADTDKSVTYSV